MPRDIREALGAQIGDELYFIVTDDGKLQVELIKRRPISELAGALAPTRSPRLSDEDILTAVKREVEPDAKGRERRDSVTCRVPVVAELVWTLETVFDYSPATIAGTVQQLLVAPAVVPEEPGIVIPALRDYRDHNVDFADAYLAAKSKSSGPRQVCTCDRKHFGRLGTRIVVPGEADSADALGKPLDSGRERASVRTTPGSPQALLFGSLPGVLLLLPGMIDDRREPLGMQRGPNLFPDAIVLRIEPERPAPLPNGGLRVTGGVKSLAEAEVGIDQLRC